MAIVESVIEFLLQKLGDQLIQEAVFLHGVDNQIELLMVEFRRMQCFLKDAEAKQEGDERVKNWVRDVRDVAYDAEDVIDTFVFTIAKLRRSESVGCITRCANFFFNESIALHKVGSEIEQIKNKIRTISDSRLTYGIENIDQGAGTCSAGRSLRELRLTSPYFQEADFVGFEEDLKALVEQLIDEGELRRCVVSVVGMGGLGKTTLTQKLYNTDSVKKHFHSRAWISVSQGYSVRDLLQAIVRRCMDLSKEELKKVEKMDVVELKDKIIEYLNNKRYLIVLDDIWTTEAWDTLKDVFPNMNNGSRVVLTTRNKEVALYAGSQPHELRFLNDDESWELFCRKAFPGRDGCCPQNLEELGRKIVGKCHHLPLAVVVIGGLLLTKEAWEWEKVYKSISWQLVEGHQKISGILSLSYKDLPYYLKPCFLYLGIFREDRRFAAEKLIQRWAAEGFLQERGEETLEEVGEDYLMQLIQRSMVQVARRNSLGVVKSCRIHDLLRDLSISEAKESKFLEVDSGNANTPCASRARRLAVHNDELSEYTSLKSFTPHLRSVLIYTQGSTWLQSEENKFLFGGFKLLRVLYIHDTNIKKLPREIGELIHLRYLGCTRTLLKRLPSSIGNLPNLQTLFVVSYGNIKVASTICKMQQLRHVQSKGFCWEVIEGHQRVGQITNLQTLSKVKAGKWMEGCLEKLTNLRKLGIWLDEREGDYEEVLYESIFKLDCLHSLWLRGGLKKLTVSSKFPENLTKLTLIASSLKQDSLATLEKLENLRILKLNENSYNGKEMAFSAQWFPRLESLHLHRLYQLKEWRVEEGAMPSLLHLRIRLCHGLKKLPEGLEHVTTLSKLEVWWMPDDFKERLGKDGGEDWHKIRHVPSIDISDRST